MTIGYQSGAAKRAVNLSLNAELVREARALTPNLSEQVERLLGEYVLAEQTRRAEAESNLDRAVEAWNDFGEHCGSFADEHSTL